MCIRDRNKDYTVSYENNVQPGTAIANVTGLGNYFGKLSANFNIVDGRIGVTYDENGAVGAAPADANRYQANEDVYKRQVYYFGTSEEDKMPEYKDNALELTSNINVIFNLNGYNLDLQTVTQKSLCLLYTSRCV